MSRKYQYTALNGMVDIHTLAPGENYFYRIKEPREMRQWEIWITQAAFFSVPKKQLLYHRKGIGITAMGNTKDKLQFVKWSSDSKFALFQEFKLHVLCEYVLLNLEHVYCYRIPWVKTDEPFWDNLPYGGFDAEIVLKMLRKLNINPVKTYKDNPHKNFLHKLFGLSGWYP